MEEKMLIFTKIIKKSVKLGENRSYTTLSIDRRTAQMEFFKVAAKCGHVGKGRFYMGTFYVQAQDGKAAAAMVRMRPRVKHDHKDAILSVAKIGYAEFKQGQAACQENLFFCCHNTQQQRQYMENIAGNIYAETDFGKREKKDNADRLSKLEAVRRHNRKMNKYGNSDIGV
jgi:hypothetical protein